ncbi:MAG: cellulase family glycosylhydrolase [Candidatus Zipacnadales bacterium]
MLRLCIMSLLLCTNIAAQYPRKPADRLLNVDEQGVLRWQDDRTEVSLFGVNYYAPCTIDYTSIKALGLEHKTTIDQDLVHLERMGLDALRLHVFDREISDEQGNLVDNHHLELLDYLIAKAKQRGIYTILTPIAWWGSPEKTHGFSDLYDKAQMHTDPRAVAAQCRYLQQFVTHKNRYTGLTYSEDPAVPCLEIINEPIPAPGTADDVIVTYIDTLYDAIRQTGCSKPVFYSSWAGSQILQRAKVEGITFGWYPSGLVSGRSLTANFLPRVNDYPSMRDEALARKAKIIYEFDAADVPGSYIYPAMARAFRSGGAQIATQFQYEPLPVAPTNADWQTHYLNLIYTPNKAVSFAIAAEAFRRLPRLVTYGEHPASDQFGPFRVSYHEDLSELVTEEVFMYSNNTNTRPPAPEKLQRIVGCGSSPVVRYEGTGAYFLERLASGLWRLEVYPDCVWVNDPYGSTSLTRETARIYWRKRKMTISVPELGQQFTALPLTERRRDSQQTHEGTLAVQPGIYVLSVSRATKATLTQSTEFVAPPQRDLPPTVWHTPVQAALEGEPLTVEANVATAEAPQSVAVHLAGHTAPVPMKAVSPYRYAATVPPEAIKGEKLTYCISVRMDGDSLVFPEPEAGPLASRFVRRQPATLLEFSSNTPLPDLNRSLPPGEQAEALLIPGSEAGRTACRLTASGFGPPPSAVGARFPVMTSGRNLRAYDTLVVRARSIQPDTSHVEVGLVADLANTCAYGYNIPLTPAFRDFKVPLQRLKPLWQTSGGHCQADEVREVSIVFGSWLFPHAATMQHGLEIESVYFTYEPPAWNVPVYGLDDPLTLFMATEPLSGIHGDGISWRQWIAPGSRSDTTAWHVETSGFNLPPSCLNARIDIFQLVQTRARAAMHYDTLHIRARAVEPETRAIEVVLTEADGAPWGFTPELTTEWQDIRLPLKELRFFSHWTQPEGRGLEGDSCHAQNLAGIHITFGAWLYGENYAKRHAFEIEFIRLEKGGGR